MRERKKVILCVFVMLIYFTPYSCSNGRDTGDDNYAAGTLVKTKYNRTKVLHNPLNGWVMYAAATADESYWDKEFWVSDIAQTVKVRDYASACYVRTSWAVLNPEDGVYAWRDPNTNIGKLIEGAGKRGLPIAFRIVVDGRDQRLNTPRFVLDAGATYYLENANYPDRITPYPQDPVFQQYYTKFIEALAEDFNDPERTSFIDAYGLGKWGEAHNVIYESEGEKVTANTERLKDVIGNFVSTKIGKVKST